MSVMTVDELRTARAALGWTQQQMADYLGLVSYKSYARVETGARGFSVAKQRAVLSLLRDHRQIPAVADLLGTLERR